MADEWSSGRIGSSTPKDQPGAWVGGWYVFEDGNVVGPLDAEDAFTRPERTNSGQPRMVSRKGFTQWYPIQDFAALHAMAGRYSDHLGQAGVIQNHPQNHMVVGNQVGPAAREQQSAATMIDAVQRELASRTVQPDVLVNLNQARATDQKIGNLSAKERKRLQEEERRSRKHMQRQSAAARTSANNQKMMPAVTFEQQFLAVSSRLRLGQPASPFARAFVYTPLSLGTYWWPWLAGTAEEVSWHLNGASRMNFVLPMWMCMIPGLHLVLAYFVARMVCQMEEQNGYRTVNPAVATVLALFPPFYIAFIQSALNRHWRLHVYHSAIN